MVTDVQLPEPTPMEESDEDDGVEPGKEYFCILCDIDCKTLNVSNKNIIMQ